VDRLSVCATADNALFIQGQGVACLFSKNGAARTDARLRRKNKRAAPIKKTK
jgi:hypothetical protein